MSLPNAFRRLAPWWLRIAAKVTIARLPISYATWRRFTLFQHGSMELPQYVFDVVSEHLKRAGFEGRKGFVVLEIGPGDSLASMIVARMLGASASFLVDVAPFARADIEPYRAVCAFLRARGFSTTELEEASTLDELMAACNARYLTRGMTSLRGIPDGTIDVAWSHATLEHVRRVDFSDLFSELHRVLRPAGVSSHTVDLGDHLGGGLNQLRFSETFWEGGLPARAGFYTNRLRHSEMLAFFERAGFAVEVMRVERWASLPTPRNALHSPYDSIPDDELRVSGFDVKLTRIELPTK